MNIADLENHKGLIAATALGIVAAAKVTFDYIKTRTPTPADKIKPFSDPEMLESTANLKRAKAAAGIKSRIDRAPS